MADNLSKEHRTQNMKAIRSTGTKMEQRVHRELWRRGYRLRRNVNSLFGKPDFASKKYKVVIFLDSCFWHGCGLHGNIPSSNEKYWIEKLERNKKRDHEVSAYYTSRRWSVLRIWEHQLKKDSFEETMNILCDFIDQAKKTKDRA
jgi:DNA mismatch endonuclease (patch repair protein)